MSTLPDRMQAIAIRGGKGPADALYVEAVPVPLPAAGQLLLRVHAAGINRPDLLQRLGAYPPPPGAPSTLGLEVAGEVMQAPEGSRWRQGDLVCALLGGGGYAEYCTVDARHALPIPPGLDLVQAAALPETVFTVFANVFELGGLRSGETFLVHGGTSGIGVAAIQMAKAAGASVIATCRGADKADQARSLGADLAIDSSVEDFVALARQAGGADVILDMVGGSYTPRNIDALKPGGRLVHIAFQAGAVVQVDLSKLMTRRLTLSGSTLRPRSADEKARLAMEVEKRVWPWIGQGRLRPVIDRVFPLTQAAQAHAYLEAGSHLGKVMLRMSEP